MSDEAGVQMEHQDIFVSRLSSNIPDKFLKFTGWLDESSSKQNMLSLISYNVMYIYARLTWDLEKSFLPQPTLIQITYFLVPRREKGYLYLMFLESMTPKLLQ